MDKGEEGCPGPTRGCRSVTITRLFSGNSAQKDCRDTVKHCSGSVGSVIANHRSSSGNSVTATTLKILQISTTLISHRHCKQLQQIDYFTRHQSN